MIRLLFALILVSAWPAFGQTETRSWGGLGTLTLSTNFVAAGGTSNTFTISSTKDVVTLTFTNAQAANDYISINGFSIFPVATAQQVEANPANRFLLSSNTNSATTNFYNYLQRYPVSGISVAYSDTNALTLTASPYGSITIEFGSGAWAEAATSTSAYTKDAIVNNDSDNVTIVARGTASGATTSAVTFSFKPGVADIAYGPAVNVVLTLSGTTEALVATNIPCLYPHLKLVSVANAAGVNLTNYSIQYGSLK